MIEILKSKELFFQIPSQKNFFGNFNNNFNLAIKSKAKLEDSPRTLYRKFEETFIKS